MNGVLEFYDTSDVVCMNQAEHFMATDVEWDPTGRFVATSVSWWAHKVSYSLQIQSNSHLLNGMHPSMQNSFSKHFAELEVNYNNNNNNK